MKSTLRWYSTETHKLRRNHHNNTQNKDYYTSTHKDVCRTIRQIIAVKEFKMICCILVPTNCYQMDPKMWAVSVSLGQGARPVAHLENNCSEERKWQGSETTPGACVFVYLNVQCTCVGGEWLCLCLWMHFTCVCVILCTWACVRLTSETACTA